MPDTTPHANLRTDSVSRVYACALFELADAQDKADSVAGQIETIGELLETHPLLARLIATPAIQESERSGILERIFHGRIDETIYRFLQVVARKDRLGALPGIVQAYADLVAERRGIVEVDVFVPARLDEDHTLQIARTICKILGGKEIALHQYIDESLIGGMKIRIGDQMIDASVASQLRQMQRGMVERGRSREKSD